MSKRNFVELKDSQEEDELGDIFEFSESEDICENSDHETESEVECSEGEQDETENFIGKNGFKWNSKPFQSKTKSANIMNNMTFGPKGHIKTKLNELDIFSSFIDVKILEILVLETNREIVSKTEKLKKQNYHVKTDTVEMKAFLGEYF